MRLTTARCIILSAGTLLTLSAQAQVEVAALASPHMPSSDMSLVPGGLDGTPDARFTNFNNKLYRTPTTNQWIAVPTTNATPNTTDQVLLLGTGRTSTVIAREGVTSIGVNPSTLAEEFLNFSSLSVPRFNDAGQWAVGFRLLGGAATDDRLVRWNGTSFDVTRGGDAAPGGSTFSGSFNSASISNSGEVSFLGALGVATSENAYRGSTRLIEMFVDAPTGQSTPTDQVWADLDANGFLTDATGTHWIAQGKVGGDPAIDVVIVVDGVVRVQEGSIIAGSSFTSPVSSVASVSNNGVWMEPDGTWFAIGQNADGQRWVLRNGVVIATSGSPIAGNPGETWETFRSARGAGTHFVINGNASGATLTDDVIVHDGTTVIARESDPVDVDGNGQFDESLYVHLVQDHMVLMDDGYCYFVSRLKSAPDATGGANGSNNASLLRVRAFTTTPACGTADFDGDGDVGTDADIEAFFACLAGNCCANCFSLGADFNADGDVGTDADIEAFFRVLAGGPC